MAPSATCLPHRTTDVDLTAITAGQGIKAVYRSQPLFVRHLNRQGNRRG